MLSFLYESCTALISYKIVVNKQNTINATKIQEKDSFKYFCTIVVSFPCGSSNSELLRHPKGPTKIVFTSIIFK